MSLGIAKALMEFTVADIEQPQKISKYLKPTNEGNFLDSELLCEAGFNYFTKLDDFGMQENFMEWLGSNKINYLVNDNTFHIQCEDRETTYKVGKKVNNLLRNSHLVRDSYMSESKRKKRQSAKQREKNAKDRLEKMGPFGVGGKIATANKMNHGGKTVHQADKDKRKSKYPEDYTKEIEEGKMAKLNESSNGGVMGLNNMETLGRLRNLAGLKEELKDEPDDVAPALDDPMAEPSDAIDDVGDDLTGQNDMDGANMPSPDDEVVEPDQVMPPQQNRPSVGDEPFKTDEDLDAYTEFQMYNAAIKELIPDLQLGQFKLVVKELEALIQIVKTQGSQYLSEDKQRRYKARLK